MSVDYYYVTFRSGPLFFGIIIIAPPPVIEWNGVSIISSQHPPASINRRDLELDIMLFYDWTATFFCPMLRSVWIPPSSSIFHTYTERYKSRPRFTPLEKKQKNSEKKCGRILWALHLGGGWTHHHGSWSCIMVWALQMKSQFINPWS